MVIRELFAKLGLKTDKRAFSAGDRAIGAIKTALIGIVAFKSVKWFGSLIKDTLTTADQFNKMSKQIGISSEALQGLEFAAKIGGTDLNDLRTGLQRFARTASDVERGLATAKDAFDDVGLSATDNEGKLRGVDEMLMDVADTFAAMPDGTRKTARAMELFGRSGAKLIPMLNEGSKGIEKLKKEFVELGGEISGVTGKEIEQMNDDIFRIKTAFVGLRNRAVIAMLPALKKLTKSFLAWIKANKELLKQRLVKVFKALVAVLMLLGKVLGFVIDHWKELTIVMGSAFLATKIMAIVAALKVLGAVSLATGAKAAIGWALGMAPLVLLGIAIAAVILIANDLWHAFTGGESVLKDLHGWAVDHAAAGMEYLHGALVDTWKAMRKLWLATHPFAKAMAKASKAAQDFNQPGKKFGGAGVQGRGAVRGAAPFGPVEAPVRRFTGAARGPVTQNVDAPITVNVTTPNATAEEIAAEVEKVQTGFWAGQLRTADAELGE